MRRFVLACFLFFLLCGALCHLQVVGFFLKLAAKSQANSLLAYREIQFEEGRLILKDAVLFDTKGQKSSYFLRSEKISVTPVWNWPLSFFVHVEKPHIIVSAEHFKNSSLSAEKPPFKWEVELEEGVLEWIDNAIPSSRFSLYLTSEESLEMGMSWEPGVLEIEKKGKACRGEWSDLPFDFLRIASEWSRFSLPISHAQGRWNGHAEMDLEEKKISLTASGKNLSFQCKQIHCETSLAFEGIWKENAVEKIRLSVEEGTLQSFPSEIQAIESLLTYQSGLGVKVVGKAVAVKEGLEIPGEWGGKVFFNRDQFEWANGDISFGKANGTLSWSGEKLERAKWTLAWEQFGAEEIAVLQGFAAKFAPMIKDWVWHSGTVQGEISFASGPLQASSPSVLLSEPNLLLIEAKDLTVETPFFVFAAKNGSYKAGNWEIEALRVENQELSFQGNAKWESQFHDNTVVLVGDIAGIHFAGTGDLDGEQLLLSIPRFEGSLPSCLWPNSRGKVQAEGNGFEMRGSWSGIEDWFLACKITEGHASSPSCSLSNFECSLMADPDSIDVLSAQGLLSIPVGERVFSASFFAPRIQWKEDAAHFDLRLHDSATDLLRLKGSKTGEKFQLDSVYSHCFGQRIVLQRGIWQKGSFSALDLEAEIDWPLFESYLRRLGLDLWKDFPKLDKILFSGHLADQEMAFTLAAPPFSQKEEDSSWSLTAEKKGNKWNIEMWVGSTACSCGLDYKEGLFRASDGRVAGPGISFAFEGTMTRTLEGALILKKIWADCKQIPSINLAGSIGGQAQVSFTKAEIQADLDLLIKETVFEGFAFENTGPLHLHYSSFRGVDIKGIDCRIHKENLEAHAKVDLLTFDKIKNRWNVQKAKTHIPSDFLKIPFFDQGAHLDCLANFSFASDFSDWSCTVKEALLPIGGSMRHVKDLHSSGKGFAFSFDAFVSHAAKWAHVSFEILDETPLRGRLYLKESKQKENPLSIDWCYQKESGLSILSIEGMFAGIDASFHAFESGQLIGSSRIDFKHLSKWLPSEMANGFEELKMGKGYELKGNLQIDPQNLTQITFQGIFSGKQLELAGFQFRTLLARVDLSPKFHRIFDLKISDSAGVLKIDDLRMKQEGDHPWTIEMPKLIIEELRPSLLVKPGKEPGSISPLVVRQFKMVDFCGLLDEGKTWRAVGELSFINSFKREQTVFDLPANVFGRIIGLDLELLIPVEGELTFELKDGYFNLGELKRAYSEGKRSEFFLVRDEEEIPRMDLDGNLQILVKMKQFVLFSLTEAFMISIDGKLNDPNFRLQKKKRFL